MIRQHKLSRFNYQERLVNRGFKMIGSGFYASVLAKPDSDRVIKLGPSTDAWLSFAVWAAENPSPHLPRVYSIRCYDTFYVAVIERLECTVHDFCCDRKFSQDYINNHEMVTEFQRRKRCTSFRNPYYWAKDVLERDTERYQHPASHVMAETVIKLREGVCDLNGDEEYDEDDCGETFSWDLHDNNVMLRREDDQWTLVITDPICGENRSTARPVLRRGTVQWKEAA
jgi:hypothetical protein